MLTSLILLFLFLVYVQWTVLPAATAIATTGVLVSGALGTAGANTHTFANTGKEMLLVHNGGVGSINVTITTQQVVDDGENDLDVEDPVIAVGPGETKLIGPFKSSIYNNVDDAVEVALSGITTVTVQVLKATTFRASE